MPGPLICKSLNTAIQIINNYCTRLSKIIDLRDTVKSRYFAITEFNICFIIRSPSFFLLMLFSENAKRTLPCTSRETGKNVLVSFSA